MLRAMKTKKGRKSAARFLRFLSKISLISVETAYSTALAIVFSELPVKRKDEISTKTNVS